MARGANNSKNKLVMYFPWILFALAVLLTIFLIGQGADGWRAYLRSLVLFSVGILSLWGAVGQFIYPEKVAKHMGYATSPFQKELGVSNLAIGIVAFISFFFTNWLIPVGLIAAILYLGCIWIHIKDRTLRKNTNGCNCISMLLLNIIVCASLFICVFIY